ncbi:MAG: cysteine desulfurase family protein [Planctomycetota bacterium]|jgi:cysteine desulfurase
MPSRIYLDNTATTTTDPDIAERVARDLVRYFANPSSAHKPGREAKEALEASRGMLEGFFPGYRAVFTASGSEAIASALYGAWYRPARAGRQRILISAVEHPAVIEGCADLQAREGAVVEEIPVLPDGRLDTAALEAALRLGEAPAIVCCMAVQNEVSAIMPLEEVGALIHTHAEDAFFLIDAVQGLGKIELDGDRFGAGAMTIASHKVHGPKGVGALLLRDRYLSEDPGLRVRVPGGGQEHGLRSGTENVAGVIGFVEACRRAVEGLEENRERMTTLRGDLLARLREGIPGLVLNGPEDPGLASPAILCVSVPGRESREILERLDQEGIAVSAGSACHSACEAMSRNHAACGFSPERSRGALRFGLSWHTTDDEIARAAEATVRLSSS